MEHIKLVCELILGLNAVDLNDEPHGNFACANLQVYMNFIVSLFEDVARNRRTTGMSSTIFDLSKKLFSRLTIRKETIIDLII